jgi:hypothetical protein
MFGRERWNRRYEFHISGHRFAVAHSKFHTLCMIKHASHSRISQLQMLHSFKAIYDQLLRS